MRPRATPRWLSVLGAHRVGAIVAIVSSLIVVTGSLAAYAAYLGTIGSIHHITVNSLGKRPPAYNSAENILVIGAYNSGKDYVIKKQSSSSDIGADTYVLVHIEPNHKGGVMISFPRDSMVPVYHCPPSKPFAGQQAQPGQLEALNETYALGGPGCTWYTLEQQTGIRIGHFVEINYLGFEKFVAAIGGANICLPYSVNIPNDGLHLKKGLHHIGPAQALKFVRARDIGLYSDLQRIQRQQFFMISVMQSALHQGLLGNPLKLYSVAHAVAPYLTTDSGFNLTAMYDLARSMQGTNLSKVQLIEVPTIPYPQNPAAQVLWQPSESKQLFSAVAHDRKVSKPKKTKTPSTKKPTHAAPAVKPSQVHVDVLNGNGVPGGAGQASNDLTSAGYNVIGTGNASNFSYSGSVVEYGDKADLGAATTLAHSLPGSTVKRVAGVAAGTVTLIVGANFNGLKTASSGQHKHKSKHKATPSVSGLAKSMNGVTGSANICKDQAAFQR